ncbi:MAG TPA: hypothetical protein VF613_08130 [Longimicrobium sp.]|jgi:hypothetical protein
MKGLREWWGRRKNPASSGDAKKDPLAEQFAAVVRDDWRERVAELQASCPHENTSIVGSPGGEVRTVCTDCGFQVTEQPGG